MIFDTDVLIWYFRGNQKAMNLLSGVPYRERRISALTMMELVQGCRNRQEARDLRSLVRENISGIDHPGERISEMAITLLEAHAQAHGLRTIDALIAATALHEDETLVTANHKHFKHIDRLTVRKFAP